LADQKNNIVKFSIDSVNQELALSVEAQDVGSGRELMQAQISGEDIEIAFNIKYLIDGLKRFNLRKSNATEYSNKPSDFDTTR